MELNLPKYEFRFKNTHNQLYIFDSLRKKYYLLTPEEWVRQHFVQYLIQAKNYPQGRIGIEVLVKTNGMNKRSDIVFYDTQGNPYLIVECKRPEVAINQTVFDQIARYNLQLKAQYLVVTNGLQHFCCQLDVANKKYVFLSEIPDFESI